MSSEIPGLNNQTEYEQRLLGGAIRNPEIAVHVVGQLKLSDFYYSWGQKIYSVLKRMVNADKTITPEALLLEVDCLPKLDDEAKTNLKNKILLAQDEECSIDFANALIARLKALSFRRRFKAMCQSYMEEAADLSKDNEEWYNRFQNELASLDDEIASSKRYSTDFSEAVWSWAQDFLSEKDLTVPTGFPKLDRKLAGGFNKGDLIVLAARPSVGKTSLAVNYIQNIALKDQNPTLFCSLEMRPGAIIDRLVSQMSNMSPSLFKRSGYVNLMFSQYAYVDTALTDEEGQLLPREKIMRRVPTALRIADRCDRIDQIEFSARQSAKEFQRLNGKPLSLIVVDYLQRIRLAPEESMRNRNLDVGEITNRLKNLALELNCPVIVLSQLSRNIENAPGRKNNEPRLSDLRDSGEIEAHADLVMFLHRESSKTRSNATAATLSVNDETEVQLRIEKNRNGETGIIPLLFNGRRFYFREEGMPAPEILEPPKKRMTKKV